MVIDAFTFFNELDLLEVRLSELNDYVDFFILVEAGKTQSLLPKPLYFDDNKDRFAKYLSKIVHIKVLDYPNNITNLWEMENHQRNCIIRGLDQLKPADDDIILISDLDEIPKGSLIGRIRDSNIISEKEIFALNQEFYAYFLNLKCTTNDWVGTVVSKYSIVNSETPQGVRAIKDHVWRLPNGGWHFSWLGGAEAIWRKAQSCIEPFDKANLPTKEEYAAFFEQYIGWTEKGFIRTENLNMTEQRFNAVNVDENFPWKIRVNTDKYKKYLINEQVNVI